MISLDSTQNCGLEMGRHMAPFQTEMRFCYTLSFVLRSVHVTSLCLQYANELNGIPAGVGDTIQTLARLGWTQNDFSYSLHCSVTQYIHPTVPSLCFHVGLFAGGMQLTPPFSRIPKYSQETPHNILLLFLGRKALK